MWLFVLKLFLPNFVIIRFSLLLFITIKMTITIKMDKTSVFIGLSSMDKTYVVFEYQ